MMIGDVGAAADEGEERCWVIATVESGKNPQSRPQSQSPFSLVAEKLN
jgi:hypothetical protein